MKINFKNSPWAHECHFYGKKQSQNQNLERKKKLPWPMSAKSDKKRHFLKVCSVWDF